MPHDSKPGSAGGPQIPSLPPLPGRVRIDIRAHALKDGRPENTAASLAFGELTVTVRKPGRRVVQRFIRGAQPELPPVGLHDAITDREDIGGAAIMLVCEQEEAVDPTSEAGTLQEPPDDFEAHGLHAIITAQGGEPVAPDVIERSTAHQLTYASWIEKAPWPEHSVEDNETADLDSRVDGLPFVSTGLDISHDPADSPQSEHVLLQGESGSYLLLGRLSASTDTEVQLAYRVAPNDSPWPCAIRRLLDVDGRNWQMRKLRFAAAARIGEALTHPHLISVVDQGEHDGVPFLVRELVDGMNLRALRSLSAPHVHVRVVATLGWQIAQALAYVHAKTDAEGRPRGLVHAEISPSAIIVARNGHAKLTEPSVTNLGDVMLRSTNGGRRGILGYAAPEQLRGQLIDPRTDIFSLGVVMAELIAGRALHDEGQVDLQSLSKTIGRIAVGRTDLPDRLVQLLQQMTRLDVASRTASAEQLAHELREVLVTLGAGPSSADDLAPAFEAAARARDVCGVQLPPGAGAAFTRPSNTRVAKAAGLDTIRQREGAPRSLSAPATAEPYMLPEPRSVPRALPAPITDETPHHVAGPSGTPIQLNGPAQPHERLMLHAPEPPMRPKSQRNLRPKSSAPVGPRPVEPLQIIEQSAAILDAPAETETADGEDQEQLTVDGSERTLHDEDRVGLLLEWPDQMTLPHVEQPPPSGPVPAVVRGHSVESPPPSPAEFDVPPPEPSPSVSPAVSPSPAIAPRPRVSEVPRSAHRRSRPPRAVQRRSVPPPAAAWSEAATPRGERPRPSVDALLDDRLDELMARLDQRYVSRGQWMFVLGLLCLVSTLLLGLMIYVRSAP